MSRMHCPQTEAQTEACKTYSQTLAPWAGGGLKSREKASSRTPAPGYTPAIWSHIRSDALIHWPS